MSLNKNVTDKNSKNSNRLVEDDRTIKSQLNASLDLKGISVSEDLIQRTLEAIRKQESGIQDTDASNTAEHEVNRKQYIPNEKSDKKIITWSKYARIIAGTVAAVFVVAVGLNAIGGLDHSKKDMSASLAGEDGTSVADKAVEVTPQAGNDGINGSASQDSTDNSSKQESSKAKNSTKKDDVATGTDSQKNEKTLKDNSKGTADDSNNKKDNSMDNENSDTKEAATKKATTNNDESNDSENDSKSMRLKTSLLPDKSSLEESKMADSNGLVAAGSSDITNVVSPAPGGGGAEYLNFQNIFFEGPEKADYIKITNEINHTSVLLNNQEDMKNFYAIIGQYQFTAGTQAPTYSEYTIKAGSQQTGETYTMAIGNTIEVRYLLGNVNTGSLYNCNDMTKLITDIEALLK